MAQAERHLDVRQLAARRGELTLFEALSFQLAAGQWGSLSGPNGSGKTTLLRVIAGLTQPTAGHITLPRAGDGAPQKLAYLGHRDGLHGHLTPREQVGLAGIRDTGNPQCTELLSAVGLERVAELQGRFLSHGQKRRLSLALLRISGAALWLLDEPSTGLDTAGKSLLRELCEWHLARGGLLLVATHEPLTLDREVSLEITFGH